MSRPRRRAAQRLAVPGLVLALAVGAGCSGDSERDQALDGLERATQASELETEMAALVTETPDVLASADGPTLVADSTEIGDRADEQISAAEGDAEFDQEIVAGLNKTKEASRVLAAAGANPSTVETARGVAVQRLKAGNQNLGSAAVLIGEDLADDNGTLSDADAEALDVTLTDIDESGQAVAEAEASVGCTFAFPGAPGPPSELELEGNVTCSEAQEVMTQFADPATPSVSAIGNKQIGEWNCGKQNTTGGPLVEADSTLCERPDGASFFTVPE